MQKRHLTFLTTLFFVLALLASFVGNRPVVAAPPAAPGAWWGDYFANRDLGGNPTLSRYDDAINFSWGAGSPGSGIPSDSFSVRWVRDEWFAGGTYRFTVLSDDGVRIWVGDQLVVDEWRDRWAEPLDVDRYIPAGTYRVRVEYYEHYADATISVGWNRVVGGATWRGEYFDNQTFAGAPTMVRYDQAIDFDWGNNSPDPTIAPDTFSVRWTRTLGFNAGTYRFLTSTDDGVRVWVDGGLVVDAWEEMKLPNTHTGEVYLADGQHTVTVEYYERGGGASAHVWWQLRETFTDWHGKYFDNRELVGGPALERNDADISFDWGVGAPVDWMPDDNFSVRWTRTVNFTPGYYRFALRADDGVRLWLDQSIIIGQWHDMDYELHYVDGIYLQGPHTIQLEYYERNGYARVRFWWEPGTNDNAPPSSIAEAAVSSPQRGGGWEETWADDPWAATYYPNTELNGKPVLSRIETSLNHDWGWGSPGAAVPKDNFSARWTQPLYFQGGLYRFTTYTDDGVRLWVDERLLIDSWRPMRGYRSTTVRLTRGIHNVKVEYYERTGVALARLTWRRVSR
ncbi:MAG: PA14 domain-containing protein [Anaerolineae bacterium]